MRVNFVQMRVNFVQMRVIFVALPRDDCGSGGVLNSGVFGYVLCAFYIICVILLFNFMNISQTYESKNTKGST